MSVSDIKRRAEQLAAASAKIKYLSKQAKLDEISQTLAQTQKQIPAMPSLSATSNYISNANVEQSERSVSSMSLLRSRHEPANKKPNPLDTEVIDIRQHNLQLEEELKKVRRELQTTQIKLEKAETARDRAIEEHRQMEEQLNQRRSVDRKPYFQISDSLFVHLSRLPISEDRTGFLNYSQFKVSLKEDLLLLRSEDAKKEFLLDSIVKVVYHDEQLMSIHVIGTGLIKDYYLIKFDSPKQLKKWDRALYMNRKLALCLDRNRLFEGQFPIVNVNSHYYRESAITERTNEDQPSLNEHKLAEGEMLNSAAVLMRIEEVESPPQSKIDNSPQQSGSPKGRQESTEVTGSGVNQPPAPFIRYADSYVVPTGTPITASILEPAKDTFSMASTIKVSPPVVEQNKPPTSSPAAPATTIQSLLVKSMEPARSSVQQRKQAVQNLTKGYVMTKYAKRGIKPHKKYLYLVPSSMQLVWQDLQTRKKNQIYLRDITGFNQKYGQGMISKRRQLEVEQCVVIDTHDRVLELSSDSSQKMASFLNDLDLLLRPHG